MLALCPAFFCGLQMHGSFSSPKEPLRRVLSFSLITVKGGGWRCGPTVRVLATHAEDLGLGIGYWYPPWEGGSRPPHVLLHHLTFLSSRAGFGPVFTTSDPDSFWQKLNEIHALGGGDEPEMCLSALEV